MPYRSARFSGQLRRGRTAALTACVLVALVACSGSSHSSGTKYQPVSKGAIITLTGDPDPGFPAMTTTTGVRVVNLWAAWCGPCADEAPVLTAAHKKLAGTNVEFIGIHDNDSRANADKQAHARGWVWPQLSDKKATTLIGAKLGGQPDTLILAPSGRLVGRFVGPIPNVNALLSAIKSAEKASA